MLIIDLNSTISIGKATEKSFLDGLFQWPLSNEYMRCIDLKVCYEWFSHIMSERTVPPTTAIDN